MSSFLSQSSTLSMSSTISTEQCTEIPLSPDINNNNNNNSNSKNRVSELKKSSNNTPNRELKNSLNGISSGVDKISLFSKDNNCILSCDVSREKEIKEAESLFENLPELVYNVTKINQWGKHQKRNLKLTNKGIENIRANNDFVSSLYYYHDIKSIYNKDSETFVIEYTGASHAYTYKSSIGYQIVQEINSRLKLKQVIEKKKHGYDIALEFQKRFLHTKRLSEKIQVTALLNISDQQPQQPPQQSQQEVNSVKGKRIPSTCQDKQQASTSAGSMSRSASFENYTGDDGSSVSSSSSSPTMKEFVDTFDQEYSEEGPQRQNKRATKLSQLLGSSEEQRVQSEVDKIILSPQSAERKSIQQFMSNFSVLLKNPATATMIIRQFLDSTKQNILNEYKDFGKVMVGSPNGSGSGGSPQQNQNTGVDDIEVSIIVEKSLEKAIILRAQKQISSIIQQQVQKDEQFLQEQIQKLCTKSQEFFGIKSEFISSNNWKSAILELSCLSRCEIPHDKMATILSSAKAIYNSINYEKNIRNKVQQDYFISADDFLPIYIYVVVNSGIKELEFTNQFLWQLSDPERLGGEGGYYLTVFSSVLSLLKSLNLENVDKVTMIDDLIPSIELKEDIQPPSKPFLQHKLSTSSDSDSLNWHGARISKKDRNNSFIGDKSLSDRSK
ncbi:vacuolar sorting protein 9 domain-containing protein [Tieghemostelium lacteum]|uniref:Vacuolar sorting protein 9 domain-containing protein n=1 Tax=Tieghemostelium lacteum TaxID=361077 RepID=A0A151Z481_TIELA|nr:vacuolar sorting protein 9 domain-containing protein [Tieghemostelium lacteum]|eukprot:KYQ88769.1 vacuolar sorting protein 9 domain-containing protein [Tieghemostelium lacteum]